MQPLHAIIKALVLCLLLLGSWPQAAIFAQTNKPQLNQQAPAGSVTNTVPVPPAININSSDLFNYERSFVPRVPIDDPATLTTTSAPSDVQVSTLYKDGFSRGMQAVAHNFTQGKSLVSPVDTRFRPQETGYLPYSSAGYGFRANAFTEQQAYYSNLYPNEGNTAYSLQRNTSAGNVLRMTSYAPGKSQVGQSRGTETLPITEACSCIRRWSVDGNGKPLSNGVYAAGELMGTLVQSPASGTALPPRKFVYKNKDGRVVLEQIADSLTSGPGYTYLQTFYIYNPQGQLCYVVPPAAADNALSAGSISQATLDQYCFQYRYDSKGRKVEQKVPGKGWEYFVYDKRDRLVFYQDSSLKSAGGWWSFTLYDALDRPTVTGKGQAIGTTRQQFAALMEDGSTYPSTHVLYYAKNYDLYHVYPAALNYCEIWSYTYYDDYKEADPNGDLWNTYSTELQFSEQQSLPGSESPQRSNRTQGLPTGSLVKILPAPGASGTGAWRRTALFYDDKGRLIYSAGQDLAAPGSTNIVHASYAGSQYTFTGQVLNTKHVIVNNKSSDGYLEHSEATRNEYEAATGRLSKTWRKVDNAGGWTLCSSLYYDELGRLQRKIFTNGGETQDYSYNIRGQLTGINGVYAETGNREFQYRSFGESLKYDYGFDKPRFDGKIAGMIWRGSNGANLGNNISSMHAYGYDYELGGRLKLADYYLQQEYNGQGQVDPWSKTLLDFTVSNLYYDKNGNIKTMSQRGVKPGTGPVNMDIMSYSYTNGNQLDAVSDQGIADYGAGDFQDGHSGAGDYSYDPNGNLYKDLNKGISSVTYNHFNKPVTVDLGGGKQIQYSYDATGSKVQELIIDPGKPAKQTDYIGNFIYRNDSLQYALTAEGRTVFDYSSTTPVKEEYFVKDHLGNVRSIIDITLKPLRQYLATYEVASAYLEGMLFEKVSEIRDEKPASTDPGDSKAGRLNAAEAGREVGTSLLVKVMAGDMVDMNVNNYYETFEGNTTDPVTPEQLMASVISTLTSGVNGMPGESHNTKLVSELFTQENFSALENMIQSQGIDPTRPQAYLTYALFDENMKLVDEFSGAYQVNGNGTWGSIGSNGARMIPTNGYLAVYLNSRWRDLSCGSCSNVFFDRVVLEIAKGSLLEENHYYPHGLPVKALSSTAQGVKDNRRKYQGNEYIKDLGLNWMDFNARQYDPQIGRFVSVDPLADRQGQQIWSPYAAMGNAPESMVDPNGTYAYANDLTTNRKDAIAMLNAMFGEGNYRIDDDDNGRIIITNPYAASERFEIFMNTGIGGGTAAVTQMAVNAGISILNYHNDPETNVSVSFGKNASGDNTITDFSWGRNLAETEIHSDGSGYTVYGDGTTVRQQLTDASRDRAWHAAKRLGYSPFSPDAAGMSMSANLFLPTGISGSINVGVIGNTPKIWYTVGGGVGTPDISLGVSVFAGSYNGDGAPTAESYMGDGDAISGSGEVGPISVSGSYSRGFNEKGVTIWQTYSTGLGLAVPMLPIKAGGNYQSTYSEGFGK